MRVTTLKLFTSFTETRIISDVCVEYSLVVPKRWPKPAHPTPGIYSAQTMSSRRGLRKPLSSRNPEYPFRKPKKRENVGPECPTKAPLLEISRRRFERNGRYLHSKPAFISNSVKRSSCFIFQISYSGKYPMVRECIFDYSAIRFPVPAWYASADK
jgi:hypothetical protein